ncbi:MAG: RNA polymerase sigma factor [Acidobacteriia bacterium]|nr:RNA polymerase sigma factor [Terriglobia bacterium]
MPNKADDPARAAREEYSKKHSPSASLEQEVTELYQSTAGHLLRYAFLLTRDGSLAQEAVQETFLKFYVQRASGALHSAGRAWLFRVIRNYILDQQKSLSARSSVSLDLARGCADKRHSPDKELERSEAVRQAFRLLSPRELECLQLRSEGFTYKEIGGILGIEPGTVGALLARGGDKIRKAFGKREVPCEAH